LQAPTSKAPKRSLNAVYLTGERVAVRAFVLADKDHASAWFPGPYPVNAVKAEEFLKEVHKGLERRTRYYALIRRADDAVIGSFKHWTDGRTSDVNVQMAPWLEDADDLRADAINVIVPWLTGQFEMQTVTLSLAADQPISIAAAEGLGMVRAVRFREHLARPGGRADLYWYQAVTRVWSVEEAPDA
jgi:RimJ/RimL family protein N-acetyltransferase